MEIMEHKTESVYISEDMICQEGNRQRYTRKKII